MPELPEVETVRRGLEPVLVGRTITAVRLARQDLRFALPKDFAARLEGRRVVGLSGAANT
jgi:formamidopyrimidine-DNA glycosylase